MSSSPLNLDSKAALATINQHWDKDVLETLKAYISIPNQSPGFDPEWETNGYMDKAVDLFVDWVKKQNVAGLSLEVLREKGRTPVLFMIIPGSDDTQETVLMYGHMDKQPPMTEYWHEGTGPHTPVIKNVNGSMKLYGRGSADDGYSIFAAINSIQTLRSQNLPHARIVLMIENCEESGSRDLPYFLAMKSKEVGTPSLVFCLDSGCHNYEQFWGTTSLRGLMMATLRVDILSEAVHSGMASGIVPSSFRIIRQLMDRIEDSKTGKLPDVCYAKISAADLQAAKETGETVGSGIYTKMPFVEGAQPVSMDAGELVLGGTWMPTLCITGADGLPSIANAGNVLRSHTALRLSLRTPPTVEPKEVAAHFEKVLTENPPYNSKVSFVVEKQQKGWVQPPLSPWLASALEQASQTFYGKSARFTGEGGSIPFMCMLGELYPQAQFVVTGLLGPSSNAHGPNETLDIEFCKKLTGCVANVLLDHYKAKVVNKL